MINQDDIEFTVVNDGEHFLLHTAPGRYRNLMQLLKDNYYLESFGSCGGMGRCATCLVKLTAVTEQELIHLDRNESATLAKLGVSDEEFRLSCQIIISKALNGAVVTLVDSSENCQ
jgi:2Fe-2S ferredoxin